jgi:hypothetical protein
MPVWRQCALGEGPLIRLSGGLEHVATTATLGDAGSIDPSAASIFRRFRPPADRVAEPAPCAEKSPGGLVIQNQCEIRRTNGNRQFKNDDRGQRQSMDMFCLDQRLKNADDRVVSI